MFQIRDTAQPTPTTPSSIIDIAAHRALLKRRMIRWLSPPSRTPYKIDYAVAQHNRLWKRRRSHRCVFAITATAEPHTKNTGDNIHPPQRSRSQTTPPTTRSAEGISQHEQNSPNASTQSASSPPRRRRTAGSVPSDDRRSPPRQRRSSLPNAYFASSENPSLSNRLTFVMLPHPRAESDLCL